MKTILSLLFALTLGTAFGQFIPQPMGYNPDVDNDAVIGVNDIMGILPLFNSTFDNGDSLVVTSWNFPEDYPTPPTEEEDANGDPVNVFIDPSTDFLYINQTDERLVYFWLPQGDGFRVLQVFLSCEGFSNWPVRFHGTNELSSYMNDGVIYVYENRPRTITFIRGHDGRWYHDGQ